MFPLHDFLFPPPPGMRFGFCFCYVALVTLLSVFFLEDCFLHNVTSQFLYSLAPLTAMCSQQPAEFENVSPTIDVDNLLRLQKLGILSKAEVRRLVLQQLSPEPESEALDDDGNQFITPKLQTKKRKRGPQYFDPQVEINAAFSQSCFTPKQEENIDPELPSKPKKHRAKACPTVANLRHLCKDIIRQRFLSQCLDKDSILWHQTDAGQMMDKLLFARAAQQVLSHLYRRFPETLHGVPGKKLTEIISWQVTLIYIYIVLLYI